MPRSRADHSLPGLAALRGRRRLRHARRRENGAPTSPPRRPAHTASAAAERRATRIRPAAAERRAPPIGPPPQNGAPPQYGSALRRAAAVQRAAVRHLAALRHATAVRRAAAVRDPLPRVPSRPPVGPEPDLAEWWRRLLGRLIDILVLTIVATPIALAVLSHSFSQYQRIVNRYPDLNTPAAQAAISKADGRLLGSWLVFACIVAVLSFFYDSIQHGLWGQTLGKRALGTRVVSADDRSKISGGTAAGRAAMYALIPVVPLIGTLFSLLNGLWLTWDRRRQALHDKAARTIVVKTSARRRARCRRAPPGDRCQRKISV